MRRRRGSKQAPPGVATHGRAIVYLCRPMKIRNATQDDLPFIATANAALATETEGQTLDPALLRPGVQAALDDASLGQYYLAEIEGKVVGQLMTTFEWSGICLYVDRSNDRAQEVYARLGLHRSNYGVMETVYRGPESHEEIKPC